MTEEKRARKREQDAAYRERHRLRLREHNRQYYRDRKEKYREKRKAKSGAVKARRDLFRATLLELKAEKGCRDCGFNNPLALDFHHIDPREKSFTVSSRLSGHVPLSSLLAEAQKCDILCANCHRILHAKERNASSI